MYDPNTDDAVQEALRRAEALRQQAAGDAAALMANPYANPYNARPVQAAAIPAGVHSSLAFPVRTVIDGVTYEFQGGRTYKLNGSQRVQITDQAELLRLGARQAATGAVNYNANTGIAIDGIRDGDRIIFPVAAADGDSTLLLIGLAAVVGFLLLTRN